MDPNLESVNLTGHPTDLNSLQQLRTHLRENSNLKSLEVKYGRFGTEDKASILIDILSDHPQLERLMLSHLDISFISLTQLFAAVGFLSHLTTFSYVPNEGEVVPLETLLLHLSSLTSLDLDGLGLARNPGVVAILSNLELLPSLTSLGLSHNYLVDWSFQFLAKIFTAHPHLTHLDLSYNNLTLDGFAHLVPILTNLTNLESLNLNAITLEQKIIENRAERGGLQSQFGILLKYLLPSLPRLKRLNIAQNHLYPQGLEILAPCLPDLMELNLIHNHLTFTAIQSVLPLILRMSKLRKLYLAFSNLSETQIHEIAETLKVLPGFEPASLTTFEL